MISVHTTRARLLGLIVLFSLLIAVISATDTPGPSFTPAGPTPVTSFTPGTTSGKSPLHVEFMDASTHTPTNWSWSFNNITGNNTWVVFSLSKNPLMTFGAGNFSIRLNASNSYGYNISNQKTFVNVSSSSGDSHGMTYFPPDHVWNYPITNLPVHKYSDHWIEGIADYSIAHCTFGTFCYRTPAAVWLYDQIPINWVNSSVSHVNVTSWGPNGPPSGNSDWLAAPFTSTLKVQDDLGQDDNVLIIVDTDEKKAYEFFQAAKVADNRWSCNGEFVWNLTNDYRIQPNPDLHPPYGLSSVSAAGVPVIAGLIKYDEINAGHIDHAAGGVIGLINYSVLWPGSHRPPENKPQSDNTYPPYSARLRLKSSVDTSSMGQQAQIIAQALKTYGVIIRDRGSYGLSITLEEDSRLDPYGSNLSGLHDLTLDDFEFVDESSLMISPLTARVNTAVSGKTAPVSAFSANQTTGTAPLSVGFRDWSLNTPTNWDWYWGNNETKMSDAQNPAAVFTAAGTYNVRLYTSNAYGGDWENTTVYITVSPATPVTAPSFTNTVTAGTPPTSVHVDDTTTGSSTGGNWFFEFLNHLWRLIFP